MSRAFSVRRPLPAYQFLNRGERPLVFSVVLDHQIATVTLPWLIFMGTVCVAIISTLVYCKRLLQSQPARPRREHINSKKRSKIIGNANSTIAAINVAAGAILYAILQKPAR